MMQAELYTLKVIGGILCTKKNETKKIQKSTRNYLNKLLSYSNIACNVDKFMCKMYVIKIWHAMLFHASAM